MKPLPPPGLLCCRRKRVDATGPETSIGFVECQTLVLALTFISYALFHAARKPPSIVKSVLSGSDSVPEHLNATFNRGAAAMVAMSPFPFSTLGPAPSPRMEGMRESQSDKGKAAFSEEEGQASAAPPWAAPGQTRPGWAPFEGLPGLGLLGEIDLVFLSCYALSMFFLGHAGDSMDLRVLLASGMVLTGILTSLFGAGYFLNIHSLPFFLLASALAGLAQASGWPCVVAVMANWYGRKGRGLLFGMWNCHTSFGNILGALIAAAAIRDGWGWAFVAPGVAIAVGGVLVFLFLPASPGCLGFSDDESQQLDQLHHGRQAGQHGEPESQPLTPSDGPGGGNGNGSDPAEPASADVSTYDDDEAGLLEEMELGGLVKKGKKKYSNPDDARAIGFFEAWTIPGVAAFAFCLFFAKLVAYTFLYWLPFYISRTEIEGHHLTVAEAGITSTVFDIGGILGGIVAGHLSDVLHARAVVTVSFLVLVVPALGAYVFLGGVSLWANVCLLAVVGFLVNGPYALITCAVSADLGQHRSLEGNARALATVTAIIDGTGSVGAAVGPFLTGLVSEAGGAVGWALVFVMLCVSSLAAVCCIFHLALAEVHTLNDFWQSRREAASNAAIMQSQRLSLAAQES